MNTPLSKIKTLLDTASSVAIFMHKSPDGDCLGSGLGIGNILQSQGKTVSYFCPTPPGKDFNFIKNIELVSTDFDQGIYDILLCVDCASPRPMLTKFREMNEEYFASATIINIDHHVSNTMFGTYNYVDAEASSVCEILSEMVQELYPEYMTPDIATCFYLGLSTDTGHFMYDTNTIRTAKAALYLVEEGADKQSIVQNIYRSKTFDQLRAIGLLGERMKKEGGIIYSRYTKEDLKTLNLDKEQIEAFLHLMSSIKHDGIFALFKTSGYDLNPMLRCSLRANNAVQNVSVLAGHFGGGGHQAAAGCAMLIEKDRESTMQHMVNIFNQHIS